MPSKNSYMIQTSKPLTPAINSSLTFLYGQGIKFIYISPNISYDINSSFDINFIGQLFYANTNGNLARHKWSESMVKIRQSVSHRLLHRTIGYCPRLSEAA